MYVIPGKGNMKIIKLLGNNYKNLHTQERTYNCKIKYYQFKRMCIIKGVIYKATAKQNNKNMLCL